MAHLSGTTSPALQHFLIPKHDSPESLYKTDYDIHCPQAITAGLNANSSGCVKRLTAPTVDKCCRQCETGREVLAKVQPDAVIGKALCVCNAEAVPGRLKCRKCLDDANTCAKKHYRNRNNKVQRKCTNCGEDIRSMVTYCDTCRPIIAEQKRKKKNIDRRHATLIRKQKKIAKQLEEMK